MADRRRAVAENVPGDFFVDETCIDCDACRQLAPEVFADAGIFVSCTPSRGRRRPRVRPCARCWPVPRARSAPRSKPHPRSESGFPHAA